MNYIAEIRELLLKIKSTQGDWRAQYISRLQDKIWEEAPVDDADLTSALANLAGDLNFYESDERDRDRELGYYGDERLAEVLDAALEKVEGYLKKK